MNEYINYKTFFRSFNASRNKKQKQKHEFKEEQASTWEKQELAAEDEHEYEQEQVGLEERRRGRRSRARRLYTRQTHVQDSFCIERVATYPKERPPPWDTCMSFHSCAPVLHVDRRPDPQLEKFLPTMHLANEDLTDGGNPASDG